MSNLEISVDVIVDVYHKPKEECLMRSIIVDFEFCTVNKKQRNITGTKLYHEIIEFGAVMLDEDMNVLGRFQKFVKPQYGKVSADITRLTGITSMMLENEMKFSDVMEAFVKWIGYEKFQICSWSMSDFKQLSVEVAEKCPENDYEYIFDGWRDTQREFGDGIGYEGSLSLKNAMSAIDESFEGKAHDALVDAENTALLVSLLADKKQFDKRTKTLQELLKPSEEVNTLGNMFGELFAQFGYSF